MLVAGLSGPALAFQVEEASIESIQSAIRSGEPTMSETKFELKEKQNPYRSVANNTDKKTPKHPMPYNISVRTGPGEEPIVIEVASICEQATKHRMEPPALAPGKKN